MKREELLAPPSYNLVTEIEKYMNEKDKLALIWQDEKGARREVTYFELIKGANKIGNAFIKKWFAKRGQASYYDAAFNRSVYDIYRSN